jgi:hypothetical protein
VADVELAPARRSADWTGRVLAATLLAYALLVGALTWPLLPRATTHMAATHEAFHFDTLHTAWMLAHESRALGRPWTLLDAGIYHPEPRTLFYSTLSLGLLPYFAPTFLLTGHPTLALNVAFLACATLTAWTIHLVVWRLTGEHLSAAVGAVTYLAAPTALWGFPSCAAYYSALQYQPLLVLAAVTPGSPLARSPWLAALIALQCVADPLYVAPAVALPLLAIAIGRLARPTMRPEGVRLLVQLCIAGLVLVPIAWGYLDVLARNPEIVTQSVFHRPKAPGAAPALDPALPFGLLVRGSIVGWWSRFGIPWPGLAVAVLGAVGILARRRAVPAPTRLAWIHGLGWTIFAFAYPFLGVASPVLRGLFRGGLVGLVALALLTGLGAAECGRRARARAGTAAGLGLGSALLAGLLLVPLHAGRAFGRYPVQPTPPLASPILDALGAGSGPVLELPPVRPDSAARALHRAIVHRRPLVNGFSSYFPHGARHRIRLAERLPDRLALALLRAETRLASVVVTLPDLPAQSRRAWERLRDDPGSRPDLRLRLAHEDVLVFDVVTP